jgi:hypothetical protein
LPAIGLLLGVLAFHVDDDLLDRKRLGSHMDDLTTFNIVLVIDTLAVEPVQILDAVTVYDLL